MLHLMYIWHMYQTRLRVEIMLPNVHKCQDTKKNGTRKDQHQTSAEYTNWNYLIISYTVLPLRLNAVIIQRRMNTQKHMLGVYCNSWIY